MADKKPTADEKLIGRCAMSAFRLGALHARDLIDDKTADRLFSALNAFDTVLTAQSKLHFSASGSENEALEKALEKPIRHLRQAFVRKVDAACRKVDKTKLTARERAKLQL
ncbi:MAG: hypothetical protein ACAH80_02145 [Alphaproteobacteria bacterium]